MVMHLTDGDIRRFWAKVALPDESGCMLWMAQIIPNGYGGFRARAKQTTAHRVSALLTYGPAPAGKTDAAHSCRNRHCAAPNHLRWASRAENLADKLRDGTHMRGEDCPGSRLTEVTVLDVAKRLRRGESKASIARCYGVSEATIRDVATGKAWSWLTEAA